MVLAGGTAIWKVLTAKQWATVKPGKELDLQHSEE